MCQKTSKMSRQQKRTSVSDLIHQFEATSLEHVNDIAPTPRTSRRSRIGPSTPSFVSYTRTNSRTSLNSDISASNADLENVRESEEDTYVNDLLLNINNSLRILTEKLDNNFNIKEIRGNNLIKENCACCSHWNLPHTSGDSESRRSSRSYSVIKSGSRTSEERLRRLLDTRFTSESNSETNFVPEPVKTDSEQIKDQEMVPDDVELRRSSELNAPEQIRRRTQNSLGPDDEYVNLDTMRQNILEKVNKIEVFPQPQFETPVSESSSRPTSLENDQVGHLKRDQLNSSNRSSSSSHDDGIDDFNDHIYQNVFDVMNSGIRQKLNLNKIDTDEVDSVKSPKKRRTGASLSEHEDEEEDVLDSENDYVTITMYSPVVSADMVDGCRKRKGQSDALHYKTLLTVFPNEFKDTQAEISKVKLSKNKVEKEEVQKYKDKKEYIVDELINTEEYYISQLQIAIHIYRPYLIENIGPKNTDVIFSELETILIGTTSILEEFKHVRMDYDAVGRTFLKNIEFFDKYPTYCKNRVRSHDYCNRYRQSIEEKQDASGDRLGLDSFLILPIQRLAKYKLLLENLLKQMRKDNLPAENIDAAITLIQNISLKGNDLLALQLIQGKTYEFTVTGNLIMRDDFKMLSPKKLDVVVFLFDHKVIFTKKDKHKPDNYMSLMDIDMQELIVTNMDWLETEFILGNTAGIPIKLNARTKKQKKKWVQRIENILWAQLSEQKRRNDELYK